MGKGMAKERFEDALHKLEKIVSKLEEGDLPLEESLKCFEEGIRLSRFCNQKLDEAEKRVEILLKDKEGNVRPEPFDPSAGSGQVPSETLGQEGSSDSGTSLAKGSRRSSAMLWEEPREEEE
jgi:exodeoxyribonuclease VII small subunit